MITFDAFIQEHEQDDTARLLLSRDKYPGIDLDLAVNTIEARRRLRTKVPEWYAVPSLVYPTRLSAEQCSSTPTARYKARLASASVPQGEGAKICATLGIIRGRVPFREGSTESTVFAPSPCGTHAPSKNAKSDGSAHLQVRSTDEKREKCRLSAPTRNESDPISNSRVADLTGGLGVDAWAFAEVFGEVLYNEADERLCKAAEHNFAALGRTNITVQNGVVEPGGVKALLGDFRPDVIYLDPARRAEDGRKVFLLEDCRPDVVKLLPELLEAAPRVLVKLSPMADISMVCQRLSNVKEVHVVASGGECKELLLLAERGYEGNYTLTAVEDGATLSWTPEEEASATPKLPESAQLPHWLFEPGKALTKAGAFRLPCTRFGLTKLGIHTHLYVTETLPEALKPFGKYFEIQEVLPLDKRTMKEAGKRWPRAEVTARNLPLSSDELRRRTGCVSGGPVHLFALRLDLPHGPSNFLLATTPL